jgi:hypothetical protein
VLLSNAGCQETRSIRGHTRPSTGPTPKRDNLKGRWLNFNVAALQAFVFDADGKGF